ncbi:MAG: hypothetical protein K0Q77_891 [Anaerosporomusa subterranea]|jgi:hypothetical protein|nr:hypothetical protein [Anaerosporomusa subterranea]
MEDLHTLCVDKSSCKAAMDKQKVHVHALTKDSFKKAYQQGETNQDPKEQTTTKTE